jgi:molecular chaperone HtpG
MQTIEIGADLSFIGQFGVEFLSGFLFASQHDDEQYIWENEAGKNFQVWKDTSEEDLIRGIKVTLY